MTVLKIRQTDFYETSSLIGTQDTPVAKTKLDLDRHNKIDSPTTNVNLDASLQKQPPRGVLKKRCSENMQHIYRRTLMPKCDLQSNFIEITLRHGCSPAYLLHIFRTPFTKNTSGRVDKIFDFL